MHRGVPRRRPDLVTIIGAGVAGLQQGRALQKRGIDFRIYEAKAGVGGVWRVTTHLQGAQGKRSSHGTNASGLHPEPSIAGTLQS